MFANVSANTKDPREDGRVICSQSAARVEVTMMLGLGHDVVDVGAFAEQLEMPGTRMTRLFSARECRKASLRS